MKKLMVLALTALTVTLSITKPICGMDLCQIKEKRYDAAIERYNDLLQIKDDNKEFYIEYRKLENEYADVIDPMENIYDVFTDSEIEKLYGVVEAEVGGCGGFDERVNVANVIFNRLYSDKFPDELNKVLSPGQFSTVSSGAYLRKKITDDTKLACEYAFRFADTTDGSIYFEGRKSNVHSSYAEYVFTDDAGHSFYKANTNTKMEEEENE